jgi:hypothetical protein
MSFPFPFSKPELVEALKRISHVCLESILKCQTSGYMVLRVFVWNERKGREGKEGGVEMAVVVGHVCGSVPGGEDRTED